MKRSRIAFGTYVAGLLLAACAAAKVPQPDARWPDTLPLFLLGAVASGVGLAMWRAGRRPRSREDENEGPGAAGVLANVLRCRDEAVGIESDLPELDADGLRARVDRLLAECMAPLVENRNVLIETYGMKAGAELILTASAAERNFNRAWSAAADGCMPEARLALKRATATAAELARLLEAEYR
jgi:hypothetical protein